MDTKATARRSAKYYKREISTIPKQDKAQHQHTMEEEHSIKISIIFRPRHREIHSQNGLIHQNLIIIKVDQSTDRQETGLPPQVEISIPETAADREKDMTTLIAVPTGAEITGNAAVFLAIPRTTGKNTARILLIRRWRDCDHTPLQWQHTTTMGIQTQTTLISRCTL